MQTKSFFIGMILLLAISTYSFAQRCGGGHGAKGSELGTKPKHTPKKKASVAMVGGYRDKIKCDLVLYRRNNEYTI
jgi:hypothetical protein